MSYREVSPQNSRTWDEEKEKEIEGVLVGSKADVGPNKSKLYTILVEDEKIGVWGATALDPKMAEVPNGAKVKITYNGKVKNLKTGREFKDYTVLVDDEGIVVEDSSKEPEPVENEEEEFDENPL